MNDTSKIVLDTFTVFLNLKEDFIQFLPSLLSGMIILIFGLVFAYLAKWFSQKIVNWLFLLIPASLEKGALVRDKLNSFSIGTGRVIFLLIILLAVTASMEEMGFTVLFGWLQSMAKFTPNIIGAILIIFVGWNLKNILSSIISKTMEEAGVINSRAISEFISWSIFFLSILIAMEQIGVDLSLIATVLGVTIFVPFTAVFLALALGIKKSFENIFACFHLKKILTINDTLNFENRDMKVLAIGPVFITLGVDGEKVSVSGEEFMRRNQIIKKE